MKYNKGFTPLVSTLIIVGLLIVGGGAYYLNKSTRNIPTEIDSDTPSAKGNIEVNISDEKFTLYPGQSATIIGTNLMVAYSGLDYLPGLEGSMGPVYSVTENGHPYIGKRYLVWNSGSDNKFSKKDGVVFTIIDYHTKCLSVTTKQEGCWSNAAQETLDASLCGNIGPIEPERSFCFENVANRTNDKSLCKEVIAKTSIGYCQ